MSNKTRKVLSMFICFVMFVGLIPTGVFAMEHDIELTYGDYYMLGDDVWEFEENDILEKVEIDEVSYIHAKSVGELTIDINGQEKVVRVNPAKVNIILVDGQSNAAGTSGDSFDVAPITPALGDGYIWKDGELKDLKTVVDAQVAANTARSVGFHPALAAALYEATGTPTVIIHQGHSGQPISKWAESYTEMGVESINACKAYLEENGYEVENTGYVWLQGESDACPDFVVDYCNYATLDEYYEAYEAMHNAYIEALGEGAVGGIITVQTRQQLLSGVGKASEYIGVRAAQQALANQLEGLVIVSDITDDWRKSTDAEKFSTNGGPIHYSQAGYNAIGADAGANLAVVWGGTEVTDFQLEAFDASVYDENATVKVSDNLIYEGTENEREHGAAQIVVKTLPVYADCAGVTMTLSDNAEGIDNNGYIADASAILGDLTLTVEAANITKEYTLSGEALITSTPTLGFDYLWDFTDTTKASGAVLTAAKGGNDLTYQGGNITVTANGMNNNSNGRSYFLMDEAITLPANEPWTIEWQGDMDAASIPIANTAGGTVATVNNFIYVSTDTDGANAMWFRSTSSTNKGILKGYANSVKENDTTKWYAIHDGNGKLTLACTAADGTVYLKSETANAITQDYTYDTVLGYYNSSKVFNYISTIKYLAVYNEAYELPTEDTKITGTQNVSLDAPVTGMVPETTVSGTGYTGAVSWSPAVADKFAAETVYTASVVLTAASGYVFDASASATVTGATVSGVAVAADGATLSFSAAFPATEAKIFNDPTSDNFYWDFTDTTKVSGDTIAAVEGGNNLTYTGGNVTANANGQGNNTKGQYFLMDDAITLSKNEAWTVEWSGDMKNASLVFSNNGGAAPADSKHDHFWYDGNGIMNLRGASGSNIGDLTLNTKEFSGKQGTWYVTHDGNGTLTLAATYNGKTLMASKANAVNADYTIDSLMGIFSASNPFNYQGSMKYMKIYREAAKIPVAKIGDATYSSLADAIAAANKGAYPATPDSATTITLMTDVESGFDIGVETGNLSTYKTQNIIIDLNGYTLTLGHPPVGSSSVLKTNGLRVLAFSALEIKNGKVTVDNDAVRIALANYGALTLTDVDVTADTGVLYTVNNRGDLTLSGATSVEDGTEAAITNQPYNYPDAQNINAKLNVSSEDVVVGKVQVELSDVQQDQTGAVNAGVPEINISAGTFGKIYDDGETAKTPVGNITGGTFESEVPENLCANGFIPESNGDGTYGVKVGEYAVEMTVNGVTTKYESINDAVAAAPVESYANGKNGAEAEKAIIKLLKDTKGGFDIGVETGSLATFKIQNVEINLNGYTLTLGEPLVGSPSTKTSGIRVLAYSS